MTQTLARQRKSGETFRYTAAVYAHTHCQNEACGKQLPDGRRPKAKFCDRTCKNRARKHREYLAARKERERAWGAAQSKHCELDGCTNVLGPHSPPYSKYCSPAHNQAAFRKRRKTEKKSVCQLKACDKELPVNWSGNAKYCSKECRLLGREITKKKPKQIAEFLDEPSACYEGGRKYRDVPPKWLAVETMDHVGVREVLI